MRSLLLVSVTFWLVQHGHTYTLIGNGHIYTIDDDNSKVEAVAIDTTNGKILATGIEADIRAELGNEDTYWDLDGRMMIPGFQDPHLHVVEAGINSAMCYIDEDADIYDIADFYFGDPSYCANGGRFGDQGWVVGNGIDISILKETVEFNDYESPRIVLDQSYPNIPVLILDNLGHGAVVNSKAMELVGYDILTDDPPGGKIDRDSSGRPTGIVRENAQQVFRNAAFPPTEANQDTAFRSLKAALGTLAANGITTVSDAGGFWKQAQVESWSRAEEEGVLTVRASNALYIYPDIPIDEQLPDLTSRYSNDSDSLVRFNQAKIYVDGILELATSALFEPYPDFVQVADSEKRGFEYFGDNATLLDVSQKLSDAGFQLHFHVTGDRAASIALDAIEASNPAAGPHRLTHCYLVNETDYSRFKAIGAVADFQLAPSSLATDYQEYVVSIVGSSRAASLLPAFEIHEAGALVVISSDWDADLLSPLVKLKTILTRTGGGGILDLTTVIRMMTINPATLLQHNATTGSIEPNKLADFAILDRDLFTVSADGLDGATVVATIFNGDIVYDPEGILSDKRIGTSPGKDAAWAQQLAAPLLYIAAATILLLS